MTALDRFDDARARGRAGSGPTSSGWDATADAMRKLIEERLAGAPTPAPEAEGRRGSKADDAKNLIVGGGPAGLSAGLHLDDPDFLLADKHDRAGGLCRSIVQDGFTFDYAGHIFFTQRQVRRRPLPRRPQGQLPRAAARELGLPLRRLPALPVPGQPLRPAAGRHQGMPARRDRGRRATPRPPSPG